MEIEIEIDMEIEMMARSDDNDSFKVSFIIIHNSSIVDI